jgi:hypothetical protein
MFSLPLPDEAPHRLVIGEWTLSVWPIHIGYLTDHLERRIVMRRQWLFAAAVGALLLTCGTARPAAAQSWDAGDHETTGTPAVSDSGSAAGGGGYYAGVIAQAYSERQANSTETSGGVTYAVSREYTKVGSPADLSVSLSLSVSGSAYATGYYNVPGAYGHARSKASSFVSFPDALGLDEDAEALYPAGPMTDSYGTDNSNQTGTTISLSASATLTGSVYVSTNASAYNYHATAEAEAHLTFSDP